MSFPTGSAAGAMFGIAPSPAAAQVAPTPQFGALPPGVPQAQAQGFGVPQQAQGFGAVQAFPSTSAPVGVAVVAGVQPPAPSIESLVSGISGARVTEGGNYHRVGHYLHRIQAVKPGMTRKHRPFLAFEMITLHVYDNANGQGHTVGENVTYMLMRDNDAFLPNLKKILATLAKVESHQITDQAATQMLASNLLHGMIVEIFARGVTTKAGKPFTEVGFRREVYAQDLLGILTPEEKAKFYPNGELEAAVAAGRARP